MTFFELNVKSEMMKTDTYDVEHSTHLEDGEAQPLGLLETGASAPSAPQARAYLRQAAPSVLEDRSIPAEQDAKKRPGKRRMLLAAASIAALGIGGYYGHYWWTEGRFLRVDGRCLRQG